METAELISRCRAGEQQALTLLYQQYRPQLINICRQYTRDENVAEDLLHDAFIIILTSLDKLQHDDRLEAWMATIVKNVGYHYREQLTREQTALKQLVIEKQIETNATSPLDYGQLQSLVRLLPEGYQKVFRLSVFEGLSHQEIGEMLGIAPHSSSSQLSHAKRMLVNLIRQSWILGLLLIAFITATQLLNKQGPQLTKQKKAPSTRQQPVIKTPSIQTDTTHTDDKITKQGGNIALQRETVIPSDTIFHLAETTINDETDRPMPTDSLEEDSIVFPKEMKSPVPITPPELHYALTTKGRQGGWDIKLSYHGQLGQHDNYLAATEVKAGSFNSLANTNIPTDEPLRNWIDYAGYLDYQMILSQGGAETRSLLEIALQNTGVNNGVMEARHEHALPISLQLTASRQLTPKLALETGLSLTLLKSTTTTGGQQAFIREQQRLRYLGIPVRISYQWYSHPPFSLYASAGAMMELPLHSTLQTQHIANGNTMFGKETSLSLPVQWSGSMGVGLQYDLTPHLGFYLEPSLQYFFKNDGADSYRTEHPLDITLPIGIRLHW